jgi:hemolysin D
LIDLPTGATPDAIVAANAQMQAQALEEVGKIADLDQQIAEKQFEVQQATATIAKVTTDRPVLEQIAGMRTTLLSDQVGSKLDWLNAEKQFADTGPNVSLAEAQENSALANVAALTHARAETQAEYTMGVMKDLEQADQKIDESGQDLIKAQQQLALTKLSAPITGTVQQLSVHTIGGIVTPAEALLTIGPDNQQERANIMTDMGPVELQPGMVVTADVKTGCRRVISYLLSPFAHQIEEAGRER